MTTRPTVRSLLEDLGFPKGTDHDEAVRQALTELLRRREEETPEEASLRKMMEEIEQLRAQIQERWRALDRKLGPGTSAYIIVGHLRALVRELGLAERKEGA